MVNLLGVWFSTLWESVEAAPSQVASESLIDFVLLCFVSPSSQDPLPLSGHGGATDDSVVTQKPR